MSYHGANALLRLAPALPQGFEWRVSAEIAGRPQIGLLAKKRGF